MASIPKPIDDRQVVNRAILQELFPWVGGQTLDILMASINSDLTPPLKIDATSTPSLTINIGPAIVSNPESNRNKTIPFIGNSIPTFAGGTITFPSASGGNITTSTGGTFPLTLPSGDYVQILLELDSSGNLQVVIGTPNASLPAALIPSQSGPALAFGYVTLQNIGGTIQNVSQSNIYYFSGGGSGSSPTSWVAKKVALASGSTSASFSFSSPQPDLSYVVFDMMGNTTDLHPQFQQVEVTGKTTAGFTAKWNVPLDTANYFLCYIVPPKTIPQSEVAVGSGSSSVSVSQTGIGWVLAQLQNTVDSHPQFQPVLIGSNSGISTIPTVQTILSGSGTYTTPTGPAPLYLRVRMVGGGGGGGGAGAGGGTGLGGTGGTTTFGTSLLVANGGVGGANGIDGPMGGTASLGVGPTGIALSGGSGMGGVFGNMTGMPGASSPFGGAGGGRYYTSTSPAYSATPNTGSGGGGGGSTSQYSGAGGAAGGYIDATINNPSATYAYNVGTGGAGGVGSFNTGGDGGSGVIIVEAYYSAGINPTSSATVEWNVNTDTANYVMANMSGATGQVAVSNGATTATITLPTNYGAASYAIVATTQNTVDSHPQFQPLVLTAQNPGSATISWNAPRDTGNYLLNYYVISLTG